MRLGVLDIGSNTVHLLVADARPGGRPHAQTSERTVLRLMRYLAPDGSITEEGVTALVDAVSKARDVAAKENVDELLATATSAVREAKNGPEVIARIEAALGQELQVLGGESEARFTFLADQPNQRRTARKVKRASDSPPSTWSSCPRASSMRAMTSGPFFASRTALVAVASISSTFSLAATPRALLTASTRAVTPSSVIEPSGAR